MLNQCHPGNCHFPQFARLELLENVQSQQKMEQEGFFDLRKLVTLLESDSCTVVLTS